MITKLSNWTFFLILLLALTSCATDPEKVKAPSQESDNVLPLIDQIKATDKLLLDKNNKLNFDSATKYVQLTTAFAQTSKDTASVIKYGNQAAEVAKNMKDYVKAIKIYDILATRFTEHPNTAANALFAKAFILENNLKELEEAKGIYKYILNHYPKARISNSIPSVISAMGKSEADLLKMIQEKNK